jgi:hypothetical protein
MYIRSGLFGFSVFYIFIPSSLSGSLRWEFKKKKKKKLKKFNGADKKRLIRYAVVCVVVP